MQRRLIIALVAGGLLACGETPAPTAPDTAPAFAKTAPTIVLTEIGPSSGGSEAHDVNDAGLVVGTTGTLFVTPSRAFLWTPTQPRGTTGTREDLGTFGGVGATAQGINNAGHVVGGANTADGASRPYLWTRAGGMQDLGLGTSWSSGWPVAINEAGEVAGVAGSEGWQRPAVWRTSVDAEGIVHVAARDTLPALPGGGNSIATSINGLGQVAGWAYVAAPGLNHAALWTRGSSGWTITDLGLLPGDVESTAEGINDLGQVVGYSTPAQGCSRAVLWTTQDGRVTSMRALETLGECPAQAWAINDQSQIVGRMRISRRDDAVMWTLRADGTTATIRDLGRSPGSAWSLAMRLSGAIAGLTEVVGITRAGDNHATLWTAR